MNTLDFLATRLARALSPLAFEMQSEQGIQNLVARLGWTLPLVPPALTSMGEDFLRLHTSLSAFTVAQRHSDETDDSSVLDSALANLALEATLVVAQLHALPERLRGELPAEFVAETRIDQEIERRLFDWLISRDVAVNSAIAYRLLRLAGVIEVNVDDSVEVDSRTEAIFHRHSVRWDRLFQFLDPRSLARDVYGWGTPVIDTKRLFTESVPLSFALSMPAEFRYSSQAFTQKTAPGANPELEPAPQLWIPVFRSTEVSFFLVATALPKANPDEPQGLALALVPSAGGDLSIPFGDELELTVKAATQVGTGVALILRPDRPPDVVLDMEGATGSALTSGRIAVALTWRAAEGETPDGISAASGTQITAHSVSIGLGAEATGSNVDVFAELTVDQGKLVVTPPTEDGLLSSVLPPEGMTAPFSLTVRWSQAGVRFQGSVGLATTIPLNVILGPLFLQSLDLAIIADEGSVAVEAMLTAAVELGPVMLTIEHLGLTGTARAVPGNLGPVDVDVSFKPPSGAGLAIDAPVVVGGGYLHFDPQKEEYSGILQLEIAETIAVKAIGLLTTRLPDGSKGFSLLILLSAEGFAPIQLGFGFTLTGIGGLLGVNRTVMVDVLRGGIKTGTLGSLLFPADPIRNAPQIVSDLRAVFPPVNNRYVFGPMAQIAWGTPTILTLELAVILEIPDPVRLIILGRLQAVLPDERNALVQVRMDAIGVIDFNQGDVSLDATLYDSRILQFVLTGDMALRASWGRQPNFVLAIGGFHPRFPAPAGFPQLERLALTLSDGDDLQLRYESYLALTSNTVQFGGRLDLHAAGGGFSFDGFLGFDALFQFAPFTFVVDVGAAVALRYHGHLLMGISLDGTLSGPTPWHIQGQATIKVWIFKVTVSFDRRFGADEPPPLPEPIDVLALLVDALGDQRNWSSVVPRGEPPIVSLREVASTPASLRVHPLAELTVRQRVVPLNRPVSRFGNAPLLGGTTSFIVTATGIGTTPLPMAATLVRDAFALAQYQEMSDDEKLARPSFETQDAGLQFGVDAVAYEYEAQLDTAIDYETWLIDPTRPAEPVQATYVLPQTVLDAVVSLGAAGQSTLRRSGQARYRALERVA